MRNQLSVSLTTALALIGLGTVLAQCSAQDRPASEKPAAQAATQARGQKSGLGFPDLVTTLKATRGCLGVETARTSTGKNVIFAWFEDKQAALRWYYSEAHQAAMRMAANDPDEKFDKPLEGVPDDVGPIMAIASITPAEKPRFKDFPLPISQISIELYKPITGGIFLGGRFAPDGLKIPGMKDYTPKDESENK